MGILFAIFLGLIGLIIGICMYKGGTVERDTFISGWWKGFFISLGINFAFILLETFILV